MNKKSFLREVSSLPQSDTFSSESLPHSDSVLSEDCARTPVGNTGVLWENQPSFKIPQVVGKRALEALIDWLQGTFEEENYHEIKTLIEITFKDVFEEGNKTRFYLKSERTTQGVLLASSPYIGGKVTKRTDAYLEISGSCLGLLTPDEQEKLFHSLESLGFRPSRMDMAIDDFDKTVTPFQAFMAYYKGNVTGFRKTGKFQVSGEPGDMAGTFSIGKRGKNGSGKFYQIYDKAKESEGEIDAIRHELRTYGIKAKQAWAELLKSNVTLWADIVCGYINGAISFIERVEGKKACDCEKLSFWSEFTDKFIHIKFRSKRKLKKTIEEMEHWLIQSVCPTLATVASAITMSCGTEEVTAWLHRLLKKGEDRMNDHQQRLLRQFLVNRSHISSA